MAAAPPPRTGLSAPQLARGLGWSSLATLVNALAQFAFLAALARLLEPAAFGLVAMAGLVLRFTGFFAHFGFAQALIQRPVLSAQDRTAALVMSIGLGTSFYLATLLAARLGAAWFEAPGLPALLAVYGICLVLGPVGSLPIALLRRQGRFKRISAIEVASFVLGYGAVGIGCAFAGLGVWSLVAATIAQQALTLGLAFAAVPFGLAWPLRQASFGHFLAFGGTYSLIGFLEFLFGSVESLLIGRRLGAAELGVFNRAANLTNLPVEQAVNALNKVLFPAFSSLQHDRSRLADGFEMLLLSVGLLSTALACGIAAAAPDVVALLLGPKWPDAALVVAIVAFATPPTFLYVVCGITLDSLGALAPKLRLQAGALAVKVALVAALAHAGLAGVAAAVVVAEVLRLGGGLLIVCRTLRIAPARCGRLIALFVAAGALVFAAVHAGAVVAAQAGAPLVARVIGEAVAGGGVCAVVLVVLVRAAPAYAPLQRFESVRAWHARALRALTMRASHP